MRPGDLVRVGVAAVLVAGFAYYSKDPARLERDFVREVADLPHDGRSLVILGYQILAVWALGLLAVGAILVWGVSADAEGINVDAVGWILMIVGLVSALLSLVFWDRWRGARAGYARSERVVEREPAPPPRTVERREVVEEEVVGPPPGGPPPP